MLPKEKKRIIVAGAGFGGVRAALDLAKNPNFQVTLIDSNPYHCFHVDLYEVGTAVLNKDGRANFTDLGGSANIPLTSIFKGKKVNLVIDKVTHVNLPNQVINLEKRDLLKYDYLVLSLGSTTNYFDIPGAEKNSHSFKSVEDALNVRNDIDELVYHHDRPIKVVIAGGGFTGVELAGELPGFLRNLSRKHGKRLGKVIILEAGPKVLNGMPVWSQDRALKKLTGLGVEITTGKAITKVDSKDIYLANGAVVGYDYLVWTTGIKGNSLGGNIIGVEATKRGKLVTDSDLSLPNYQEVFVIGDLAECIDTKRNCPIESTARVAIEEGAIAARNIIHHYKGEDLEIYHSPWPVFVVPVGKKYALASLENIKIEGLIGWLLKKFISLKYYLTILPLNKALTVWFKGVKIYSKND